MQVIQLTCRRCAEKCTVVDEKDDYEMRDMCEKDGTRPYDQWRGGHIAANCEACRSGTRCNRAVGEPIRPERRRRRRRNRGSEEWTRNGAEAEENADEKVEEDYNLW